MVVSVGTDNDNNARLDERSNLFWSPLLRCSIVDRRPKSASVASESRWMGYEGERTNSLSFQSVESIKHDGTGKTDLHHVTST
jgi:hypothetical protein